MSGTIQVLEDNPAQPRLTFYSGGVLTDLDSSTVPVVTLTRPDGTAGPASGTVTRVSVGTYTFTLAASSTTDLTIYTVVGTGNIGGLQVTDKIRVEVVGDFLFNIADLRAVTVAGGQPFTTTTFPDNVVMARRAEVTDDFEQRTGWSFIPRFTRERFSGDLTGALNLGAYRTPTLLSVTVDGAAQILSGFDLDDDGTLTWTAGVFPATRRNNVIVEYVRGWDRPPAKVSSVGLAGTAALLLPSQYGSAAVTVNTPDGNSYSYSQAGQSYQGGGRRYYGIPDIDAVLSDPAYNARRGGVFA